MHIVRGIKQRYLASGRIALKKYCNRIGAISRHRSEDHAKDQQQLLLRAFSSQSILFRTVDLNNFPHAWIANQMSHQRCILQQGYSGMTVEVDASRVRLSRKTSTNQEGHCQEHGDDQILRKFQRSTMPDLLAVLQVNAHC